MPTPVSRILALYERLNQPDGLDTQLHRHTFAAMKLRRSVILELTDALIAEGFSLSIGEQAVLAQYASGNLTKQEMLSHFKLNLSNYGNHWKE